MTSVKGSAHVVRNFVNGEAADTSDGTEVELIDPSSGEVYGTAQESAAADVDAAFQAAARAFEAWRQTTPSDRQRALLQIADLVEEHADELVALEARDTGKPIPLTRAEEIPPAVDHLRFFAGAARTLSGLASGEYMAGHTSSIRREPVGVVAQVTPWNYPLLMAVWKFAPALAVGNAVVIKPAETTPSSTVRLAELIQAADVLPPGVLNVICGGRDTGRAMIEHPIPAMVAITGSVRAGIEVASAAARGLKRVHLELGGKAPVIVFDDAESISAVAEQIAIAGYFNAGQDCTAATRVLAGSRVSGDLAYALAEQARAVVSTYDVGADSEDAFLPPLNNEEQFDRVRGYVDRLPDHARMLAGGSRIGDRGFHYQPSVIADVKQTDEISQNEVFGPVITVQTFFDEEQALRWANGTGYGLASSVWTSNFERAARMSRDLNFGCVWINTHLPLVAEMPHGGFGQSGYGKDLSTYALEEYTRVKHVMANIGSQG